MADTPFTDEYVASLLAKDAKDSSIKYSAIGMEGLLTSKPPVNKPKPNTRFLRNIIKETDSHNAALLAKEAADSKARLATMEVKKRPAPADMRRRQLGHITAHLTGGSSKRRRKNEPESPDKRSRRQHATSEDDEPTREDKNTKQNRENRHRERDYYGEGEPRRRTRSPERDRRRHRSRSRSRSESLRDEKRSKDSRHRHSSPHRSSRHERPNANSARSSGRRRSRRSASPSDLKSATTNSKNTGRPAAVESDSDPLDDIIGPRKPPVPTVRSRGRGLMSSASGIDGRFSENYDPQSDVALDPDDENDWEQALEALRDRRKYMAKQAERLRSAGFTDAQVANWETGGEKREEDVKWVKNGESREWDKGKAADGSNVVDENWGRLKDT